MVEVKIKLVPGGKMPEKKTVGAAAFDCYARVPLTRATQVGKWVSELPKRRKDVEHVEYATKIPLGFCLELPPGYCAKIVPRSSTGKDTPLRIANAVGLIDSDYRGEVCILLDTKWSWPVNDGDRICQMIIEKLPDVELVATDELSETARGTGGFGSTGK